MAVLALPTAVQNGTFRLCNSLAIRWIALSAIARPPCDVDLLKTPLAWQRDSRRGPHCSRQAAAKAACLVNFLLLAYANTCATLPQVVANPDITFLTVSLGVVISLCVTTFAAGWGIARLLKADRDQQTALMFGLGMNSNAVGLVLASATLAGYPLVIVPVITHTLVQQLVAGVADPIVCRPTEPRGQHFHWQQVIRPGGKATAPRPLANRMRLCGQLCKRQV
jgi:hypothetical protein